VQIITTSTRSTRYFVVAVLIELDVPVLADIFPNLPLAPLSTHVPDIERYLDDLCASKNGEGEVGGGI
jgi:hypothetical protein